LKQILPQTSGNGVLLELLAEFFHSAILGANAKITRRKVYRRKGRVIAEIDLLLEGQGQRFAIECRDRRLPQGLPWIQQIIGKRVLLQPYRINDWFALSASGFTEDAIELASVAGIHLLVPGSATPADPNAPGVHRLMKFEVRISNWDFDGELEASIGHDNDETLDVVERYLADESWSVVQIGKSPDQLMPIRDFVDAEVRPLLEQADVIHANLDYSTPASVSLKGLVGSINRVAFEIASLTIPITLSRTTIAPDFRILTIVSPVTHRPFAIIGLNTYERNGQRLHLMVHVKPGRPQRFSASIKDDKGRPVSGALFNFPAHLVTPPDDGQTSA
jgi:hypothetical protein